MQCLDDYPRQGFISQRPPQRSQVILLHLSHLIREKEKIQSIWKELSEAALQLCQWFHLPELITYSLINYFSLYEWDKRG